MATDPKHIVHPERNEKLKTNDLGIITLDRNVKLGKNVNTICVDDSSSPVNPGDKVPSCHSSAVLQCYSAAGGGVWLGSYGPAK